jgi:membrane associated rhomboid family serine protease
MKKQLFIIGRVRSQQLILFFYFFTGAGCAGTAAGAAGAAGALGAAAGAAGAACFDAGMPPIGAGFALGAEDMIDWLPLLPDMKASDREVSMKMIAALVVSLLMNVLPPPAPKTDWLPLAPKDAPISAPFPD